MTSAIAVGLLFAACLQIVGLPSPPRPPDASTTGAEQPGTGVIAGRVVTMATGAPLGRTTVTAQMLIAVSDGPPRQLRGRTFSSRTRPDGTYAIANLPTGQFTLTVARDGYFGDPDGQHSRQPITVADGASVTAPDLRVYRGGVLSGRVLDDGGEPVIGAYVSSVARMEGGGPPMREVGQGAVTDDRGVYRLHGLLPGRYTVLARPRRLSAAPLGMMQGDLRELLPAFAGAGVPSAAHFVDVDGDAEAVLDVRLERGRPTTITGRVAIDEAAPFAQGMVSLHAADPAGAVRITGDRVWPSGGFQLSDVPPGRYLVVVEEAPGDPTQVPRAGWTSVDVDGQAAIDITVPVGRGVTAAGRIEVEGGDVATLRRTAVRVEARPASYGVYPGSVRDSPISADLTFTLTGLRGPRRFRIHSLPAGWWVKAVTVGGRDATTGYDFPARGAADPIEIVVSARPTGIRGSFDGASGSVEGALVMVVPAEASVTPGDDEHLRLVSAQPDRTFAVEGLRPGPYVVVALAPAAVAGQQRLSREGRDAFVKTNGIAVDVVEGRIASVSLRLIDK